MFVSAVRHPSLPIHDRCQHDSSTDKDWKDAKQVNISVVFWIVQVVYKVWAEAIVLVAAAIAAPSASHIMQHPAETYRSRAKACTAAVLE